MNAVIGSLRVDLGLDTAAFEKGVGSAKRATRQFGADVQKSADAAAKHFERMSVVGRDAEVAAKRVAAATTELSRAQTAAGRSASQQAAEVQVWLRRLDGLEGAAREAARSQLQLGSFIDGVTRSATRQGVEVQAMVDRLTGVERATEGASQAAGDFASRLNQQASAFDRLRGSLNLDVRRVKMYAAVQQQVNAAVQAGIVSQQEAARVLDMAEAKYLGTGQAAQVMGAQMRGASMHTTNLMFQFQDIGMMLAAGQNPLMLAMQQGTQVAGVFQQMKNSGQSAFKGIIGGLTAMVSPISLVTIGAIAGGAALVQWAVSAFGAGEEATLLEEKLASLKEAQATLNDEIRGFRFGVSADELTLLDAISEKRQEIAEMQRKITPQTRIQIEAEKDVLQGLLGQLDVQRELEAEKRRMVAATNELADIERQLGEQMAYSAHQLAENEQIAQLLRDGLSASAVEALRLANVDMASGINDAARSAAQLAANLNVSLMAAINIKNLQASIDSGGGRGQDPRKFLPGGVLAANASNTEAALDRIQEAIDAAAKSAGRGARATGGLSKEMKSAAKEAERMADEIERLEFDADPVKKYASQLADLDKIMATGRLTDGAYAKAVQDLNDNLAGSIPMVDDLASAFGEFIGSGLRNFKEFGQSIIDTFKNMIVTMVTTAARNRILFSMGITGGGIGGAAQAAVGGGGGGILGNLGSGGGILGGLGAGLGNLIGAWGGGGGILGGLSATIGATLNGGIGAGLGAIGANLSGALAGGMGSIGAAIGSVIPVIGIAAAAFSFFRKKTKELDAGLRITTDGMDSLIQSFSVIETKRFWGLSKKVRTSFSDLDEATAGPLERIITDIQMGVAGATKALGIGADVFDSFTSSITVSTKGMSDADAQKAVEEALEGFGDDFAGLVPGLEALQQEGEGAYAALTRLSTSLGAANTVLDTLGAALYEISLSGAAAASSLVQAFGGLDQFNAATTAYYAAFYTEQERIETATRQVTEALADLGQIMPDTRAQFRAIVEAQDLSTESGRKMFASLVGLAGQLDLVLPSIDSLADKLGALTSAAVEAALGPINDQITASNAAATQARQSADEFFRLADSLRASASGIGGVRTAADVAAAGRDFAKQFRSAITGGVTALGGLGAAGTGLAQNGARFATTQEDARFLEAQIATQLNQAASVAEALGLGADYQAMLFDVQTAALEVIREGLAQGNITQDILRDQIAMLENIGKAIVDSTDMQIAAGQSDAGRVFAGLIDNSGRVVAGLSAQGAKYIGGLADQNTVFGNLITGQTGSITGTQSLTNDELGKVRDLQGETVSITELVERAVAGSETLNEALLNRLSDGISVSGVPSMVSGLNNIGNLLGRIVSAQEAALAAAEAEANRQAALTKAQAQLESTFTAQKAAIGEVSAASAAIYGLASQFGVYVNAKSGAVDLSQSAKFGVNDKGLFEAQYGQISLTGGSNAAGFKNTFYQDGGLYSQTYGRAGELRNLAAELEARRQAIRDLGGVPAFARGGMHTGGLRIVGEDGPELEATGPARIYNNNDTKRMFDNSEMVAELRALREEVSQLRSENNQGHRNTGKETERASSVLRKFDQIGLPKERTTV